MFQKHKNVYSQLPIMDSGSGEWNKVQEKCSKKIVLFVFFGLFIARLASALLNNINDCDETFNYWEPGHFLVYGKGFQTWEYSPLYAIRSYFYLWLYMAPAKILTLFALPKVTIFYSIRALLAFISASCETFLFRSVFFVLF